MALFEVLSRSVLERTKENHYYRGADKSLARPDKKKLKSRQFSSDAEVIAATETWLDGQPSELFLSDLQKFRVWSL